MTIKIKTKENLIVTEASSIKHIEFRNNFSSVPGLVLFFEANRVPLVFTLQEVLSEDLLRNKQSKKFEAWDQCEKIFLTTFDLLVAAKQANHGDFDLTDFVQLGG